MKYIFVFLFVILVAKGFAVEKPIVTELNFVAYEDQEDLLSLDRFSISGKIGVGYPKMKSINNYIRWINDTWHRSINQIRKYWKYNLQIEYRFKKDFYAGIGYEGMHTRTVFKDFRIDLKVDGGIFYIKKVWPKLLGNWGIKGTAGAGYYTSKYIEREGAYEMSGRSNDWGTWLGLGLLYQLTNNFQFSIDGTHHWLKFTRYKQKNGSLARFVPTYGGGAVEADFTGFTASAELSYSF